MLRDLMKQAYISEPRGRFAIRRVPVQMPGPSQVLLRVTVATICSRTDLGTIEGFHPPHGSAAAGMLPHDLRIELGNSDHDVSRPYYPAISYAGMAFPAIMGHEAAGVVEELGEDANSPDNLVFRDQSIGRGDRVATYKIHGGYSEYAALASNNIIKTPSFMTDEEASLFEPLIANYNCIRRCWSIAEPETVMVIGQGCQGLFATQVARALGAKTVIVSEPSAYKRALALELGADIALDPKTSNVVHEVERLTSSAGADLVVECVGQEETIRSAPFLVRRGGMLAQIGALTKPVTFDYGYTHFKHFIVVPVDYFDTLKDIADQVEEVLAFIAKGVITPGRLITHRFTLDEIDAAFEFIRRAPDELVKVAIDMRRPGEQDAPAA